MMAVFTYRCLGSEVKTGGRTLIPIAPVSGYSVTHLFVNGGGILIEPDYVSAALPVASVPGTLNRGDVIKLLYKNIPRWTPPEPPAVGMIDFAEGDFSSTDFY